MGSIAVNDELVSAERSTDDERILRTSRTKWLAILLGSAAFVAFGLFILPTQPFAAWASIVFCGLCGVGAFVVLLPGSTYLRLTPEGYEMRAAFRTWKQPWQHIERFQGLPEPHQLEPSRRDYLRPELQGPCPRSETQSVPRRC